MDYPCDVRAIRSGGRIVVSLPDGSVRRLGGERVKRAEAVVVARWGGRRWRVECRGDVSAAFALAARYGSSYRAHHHGYDIGMTVPADFAVAVLVEDGVG